MKDTEADKPAEVENGTVAKKDVVVEKPAANAAKEASAKQLPTTGFEVPQRGAVCYGGRDLARLDARALRRNIGVVLQGEKLFGGSIYDNIAISAPGLSRDDAWAAAELAGVADDIRAMPMSMHTMISESGGGTSGGQRQRLMIARPGAEAENPHVRRGHQRTG